jgi:hypothetical protein
VTASWAFAITRLGNPFAWHQSRSCARASGRLAGSHGSTRWKSDCAAVWFGSKWFRSQLPTA